MDIGAVFLNVWVSPVFRFVRAGKCRRSASHGARNVHLDVRK
jgi:hypothetical protein